MTNRRVEDIDSPDATPAASALNQTAEATDGFRLSPQQRHLWRLRQSDGGRAYVAQCVVRINGPLRHETLRAALKDVIQKHEILRTRYVSSSAAELPKQVIDENTSLSLDEYRVPGRDAQAFEARCEEVLKDFVDQARELGDRPLTFSLVTDSSDRSALLISAVALSMDAPGLTRLVGQICRAYDARSKNEEHGDDPLQYADLAEWQNELLEGEETAAGRAFWEDLDLAVIRDTKLPPFPRAADSDAFSPQLVALTLGADSQRILAFSRKHDLPVSAVLLTAWHALLGRLTGPSEVVIAVGCEGRNDEDLEESLGLFERYLPLKLAFDEDLRFVDALQKIKDGAERAAKRQGYFSWELLAEPGDNRPEPFCPIGFNFSVQPAPRKVGDVSVAIDELNGCTDRFAIRLSCIQNEGALAARLHFDPDRYVADDIRRLGAQFSALLSDALERPECQISELVVLSDKERQKIARWNDGERIEFPEEACLHELIEQNALRSPDCVAVVQGAQQITYRQLNASANQLARYLRDLGVDRETLVGICVNRSIEMAVALLAIAKAGGAYMPMDPAYPPERLRYMLDDSRVTVLLTQQHLVDSIPESDAKVVVVDAADAVFGSYEATTPATGVTYDNLSYVIYTSGSTGTPKGVMLNHQGRVNNFLDFNRRFSIGHGDRIIALASLSFDMCAYDMFGTLAAGATIVMPLPEEMQEPRAWADRINNHMVSIWHTAPAMLQMLVDHLESHTDEAPQSLRLALLGGDWIPVTLPDRLRTLVKTAQVISMGGATECSMDSTIYEVLETDPNWKSIPYGQPMKNQREYVLDAEFDEVPFGVPGELYLGGIGVGRGYFRRPEFTAQRFVPDPYVDQPGARMYRTGDLAQWMPDGNTELLGRMDHQVKIRGYRIELGEIESVLRRHDAVREAVVVARNAERGDKMLVAYVVAEPGSANVVQQLRGLAKEKLPDYMMPSAYVTLDALPLTPNGKVDRKSLPAPEAGRPELEAHFVEPRTEDEVKLAKIWSDVLHVERVGAEDNFFELGGHSLLATQVVSRIRSTFDIDLPLRSLFESPTVASLAQLVQAAGGASKVQIPRRGAGERDLPLSFAQERLWFLDQLTPGSSAYNIPYAGRFLGPLNAASLDQLLREVVRRHESLRTRFPMIDGRPHQAIGKADQSRLRYVDLSGLPAGERLTQCQRLAAEEGRRPFDLTKGPLVRATLLRLEDREHAILLTMHHVVSDAWSLGVLSGELSALYEVFALGQPSQLPELPIQYADYAVWQRRWLDGSALEAQLAYWKGHLAGASPSLNLPTDRPRPAIQTFQGANQSFVLSEKLTAELKSLSQREGATLFMTLMAAFQTLLHRYTGDEDVLVGTPIAGRSHAEVEGLIGFFVNTLVMRADLGGDPSFRHLLGQVRETALEAYANQDLPFETLVDKLKVERDLSRTPLFQVMFSLDSTGLPTLELPTLKYERLATENRTAKFDLIFNVSERTGGLGGSLEYNTDLFDAATIERMLGHFQRLLEGIVANPEQRLSELAVLSSSEQHQLLVEWNATEAAYPRGETIHQLFEAQVAHTPDRVALVVGDEQLSYRALNARANQLARALRRLGVGPQVLVGVCVERSVEMVVGLLGILKAGGAYVAMDPAYPEARLRFILDDTKVPVLLTQEQLTSRLPDHTAHRICLDTEWDGIAGEPAVDADRDVPAGTLSHVIYTSGSTGRPKGVAIEHRSVVTLLHWSREHYASADLDGVLASTSICFDLSVWELFVPLSWGGTVHLAQNALQLPELATAHAVTLINTVPSAIAELVRQDAVPASVRRVNLAGEPLSTELVRKLYAPGTVDQVCDLYGPSEDTTYSTFAQRRREGPATIGRPIANTQLYLLNQEMQPVPLRVSGELHLGGDGLARGYLQRPEMTADRFIPDPFGNRPGGRLYRTGDLARYLADGNVEFLGRRDYQVKIRGFRIELGEIEEALKGHRSLRDAVVLARQDGADDPASSRQTNKRLVAYVVAEQQPGPTVADLRSYLKERLPDYMVPAVFVPLDALPLTPNGKLDRKALLEPDQTRPKTGEEFAAAQTREEKILASIWSDVLRVQLLGVHDNFFDLGGDSILSIQIVSKANQAGLRLTPRDIFQHQTVAALAAAVGTAPAIEAEQGLVTGPVLLTPIQDWFFEQNLVDPHHFNQAILLEVKQKLDPHLLRQAIEHLISHHDALRLRFIHKDSRWEQRGIDPDDAVPFRSVDLSDLEGVKQQSALEGTAADLQKSLHLSDGPLLQVALFDLGPNRRQRLFLVIHHMVVDGVSWRLLLEDLQTAYDSLVRGDRVQLPAKTTSFARWAERLQEHAQSPAVLEESPYWLRARKANLDPLPVDFAAGENIAASARGLSVSLDVEQTEALLKEVPEVYHTQINDVLLTAVVQAYESWTGQPSLLLDVEGHGREPVFDDVDVSRTVGWFTTLYPIVLQLEPNDLPGEALKSIKEQLRAVPNRGFNYGVLRYGKSGGPVAEFKGHPNAEVSFNYLGQFGQSLSEDSRFSWASGSSGPVYNPRNRRPWLLQIDGYVQEGQLTLVFGYSESVHRRESIERLSQLVLEALQTLISHCLSADAGGATPSDFPLASLDVKTLSRLAQKLAAADERRQN
jgi:amino acid adenylation domain-containing protein/non-ribosomal peptide synthase protein (TIGR01720 family)